MTLILFNKNDLFNGIEHVFVLNKIFEVCLWTTIYVILAGFMQQPYGHLKRIKARLYISVSPSPSPSASSNKRVRNKIRASEKEPATRESGWLFLYDAGNVLEIYAIKKIGQRDT